MSCEICGRGAAQGVSTYRANLVGEMPARWRCKDHPCLESFDNQHDQTTMDIESAAVELADPPSEGK